MLSSPQHPSAQAGSEADRFRRRIRELREQRTSIARDCTVVRWEHEEADPADLHALPVPGTVTMYCDVQGATSVQRLTEAYLKRNVKSIARLTRRAERIHQRRAPMSFEVAYEQLAHAPAFFDLLCDGQMAADSMWAPTDAFARLALPHRPPASGVEGYSIIEHPRDDQHPVPPAVLVVVCPLTLSDIEAVAVKELPPDREWIPLGGEPVPDNIALLGIVTVCFLLTTMAFGYSSVDERLSAASLSDEALGQINQTGSTGELLGTRAALLQELARH